MIERYSTQEMKQIWSDQGRYNKWLEVELAVCDARSELDLMPKKVAQRIRTNATFTVEEILEEEAKVHHDVIAFVSTVGKSLGSDACYFHEGLTSSDVLDTALALQLMEASKLIENEISRLLDILSKLAHKHKYLPIVGRTHGVHAEPTSFGLKVALWYSDVLRSQKRFNQAVEEIRVAKLSGAVGNFAHLTPEVEMQVSQRLNLRPEPVATQVVQRDRHAAYLCNLALIASIGEKIAMEIRHLQKSEVLEVEEPFGKNQKGSSAMPHKRNPVLCENICGLARIVRSFVSSSFENIPLWHERDISHSAVERISLPDSTTVLHFMLRRLSYIIEGLNVNAANMQRNLECLKGLIFSQKVLLALTAKKIPRDQAYAIIQRNAMKTWNSAGTFLEHLLHDSELSQLFSKQELESLFDIKPYLQHVGFIFKRAGLNTHE